MEVMNIIIPLGGVGKRFSDTGYNKPKPLIKALGREIIFWLLDSLNLEESDTIYIPYNENLDNFEFSELITSLPSLFCVFFERFEKLFFEPPF